MLVNYVGPRNTFTHHSFKDVDDRAREGDRNFFRQAFAGKIVLIGPTDVFSQDLKLTPFNEYRKEYPGVEIHASAINTILHRDFISRISPFWRHFILLALMTLYFLIGYKLSFARSLLVGIAVGVIYWLCAIALFQQGNLWVDLSLPKASLPVVLLASYAYRAVESFVSAEDKGCHRVKGKDQELHIYALLGKKDALTSQSTP
jgi:CHASE2 domain-containing sensor protein